MNAAQPIPPESPILRHQACEQCTLHRNARLYKLGEHLESWDYLVALAGNPNTGKSTIFNALTGLRQHTGNWPGKTVTRAEGGFIYDQHRYKLIDLPGTYSLLSNSTDEEIARNFLLFGQPDVTLIVVDATILERNLNLVLQVLEITPRAVLCLNMMDEARKQQLIVDERSLARDLGIPVVPMAARRGEGIPLLLSTLHGVATRTIRCQPPQIHHESAALRDALAQLVAMLDERFPGLPNARWVALRLLDGDETITQLVRSGDLASLIPSPQAPSTEPLPYLSPEVVS